MSAVAVTIEEIQQVNHPNPSAASRRRFVSENDKRAWLAMVRERMSAAENARIARSVAARHGEEL